MALLVITSCISPNRDIPFLTVNDSGERCAEYEETIRWAIYASPFTEIVYADNSGCSLEIFNRYIRLAEAENKKLELLSFLETDNYIHFGKGYGEGSIIEYALSHSRLVRENKEQYFYKITGRLRIENITGMMERRDLKKVYLFRNYPLYDMLDTRFYGMPVAIYQKYFLKAYTRVNDKELNYLEKIFYEICQDNHLKYDCMKGYPWFQGRSGSTGKVYQKNPNQRLFDFLCRVNLFNHSFIYKILLNLKSWNLIRF